MRQLSNHPRAVEARLRRAQDKARGMQPRKRTEYMREYMRNKRAPYRDKRKQAALRLLGGKCVRCGYREHIGALDFDHIDPATKEFGIATRLSHGSDEELAREISKCQVLCANCHRLKTKYPEAFKQPPSHYYD